MILRRGDHILYIPINLWWPLCLVLAAIIMTSYWFIIPKIMYNEMVDSPENMKSLSMLSPDGGGWN